jgi:uncharacterized UBP type Zn finger protein
VAKVAQGGLGIRGSAHYATAMAQANCPHFDGVLTTPRTDRCEECGATFNLRVCTSCGYVGCCESQQGHNTAHAKASGHPVIKSLPLKEGHFTWCYSCNAYLA